MLIQALEKPILFHATEMTMKKVFFLFDRLGRGPYNPRSPTGQMHFETKRDATDEMPPTPVGT